MIGNVAQRCCVMESCDFVNEEFPAEIQKLAKKQQVLVYAKYSNFLYTVLPNVFIQFLFFYKYQLIIYDVLLSNIY